MLSICRFVPFLAIALFVLRIKVSDYPFSVFKLVMPVTDNVTPSSDTIPSIPHSTDTETNYQCKDVNFSNIFSVQQ